MSNRLARRWSSAALMTLAACWLFAQSASGQDEARDRLVVETLLRLDGYDLSANPKAKAAVLRHMKRVAGSDEYVELAGHFKLAEASPQLLEIAVANPSSTRGVRASTLVVELSGLEPLARVVEGKDPVRAGRAVSALGYVDAATVRTYLLEIVTDTERSRSIRNSGVRALGRTRLGERALLRLASQQKVQSDITLATANILLGSLDPAIKAEAARYFKLPAGANATPLPPLSQLLGLPGNAARGAKWFTSKGTCVKCHKVLGQGKEVGPDLTEIGSKLSREALFVSILDPSAGISHNYETYLIELKSGNLLSGILVSQTDEALVIRTNEAIDKQISRSEIDFMKKSETSLMPADLVKLLKAEELADLVAYLSSLKKKS